MNAIVNTGPGRLEWKTWPTPEPARGQVRIRTVACGICATDLEMIAGWARTNFPAVPGHEWSGIVDAIGGGVDAAWLGQPCVAENVVSDGGEVGFEHPGGYGQYFLTDAKNLYPLPRDFPLADAALIEPLAVCVRAIRRLYPENLNSALVLGDGNIGLLMLQLLKLHHVKSVSMVGGRPTQLELARQFGADHAIDYHDIAHDMAGAIHRLPGAPFPNIAEASGAALALHTALDVAAVGGKIVVIGDYGHDRADFPWNRILHRELSLIGSNASAGAWPRAVALATSGAIPLSRLISKRLPAAEFAQGIELARKAQHINKVLLEWEA